MISILEFLEASGFWSGFGIFTGIVAGALIQHLLNFFSQRRQAKNALKVMQIEIAYNRSEVEALKQHLAWLKQRIASQQLDEADLFLPMQRFDYSSIAPLTNAGYFHVFLGPERVRSYLEFHHFFRIDNGVNLTKLLRQKHKEGSSMAFLEWAERRATELVDGLAPIERSTLSRWRMALVTAKTADRN